jgi:hypothetical protein
MICNLLDGWDHGSHRAGNAEFLGTLLDKLLALAANSSNADL